MNETYDYGSGDVLLIDPDGNVIAQLRDDKPTIHLPGKASFFGGRIEDGEDPIEGTLREISEETNLHLTVADITFFMLFPLEIQGKKELHHIFVARNIDIKTLEVYEGQGAHLVKDADDPLVADEVRPVFKEWFAKYARVT